jgi:hypothetical protein
MKSIAIAAFFALTALPVVAFAQQNGGYSQGYDQPEQGYGQPDQGYSQGQQPSRLPMTPAMRSAHQAMKQACYADEQQFCSGPQSGPMMRCLKSHAQELSQPCQSAIANFRNARRSAMSQMGSAPNGQNMDGPGVNGSSSDAGGYR